MMYFCGKVVWQLTIAIVPSVLQLTDFCPQLRPQRLEGGAVVHVLYLGRGFRQVLGTVGNMYLDMSKLVKQEYKLGNDP